MQAALKEINVGWPVANASVNEHQVKKITELFEQEAPRAKGDLKIAAEAWLQGFYAAAPYLPSGNEEQFNANVSNELKKQLHLANVTINNICQWSEW